MRNDSLKLVELPAPVSRRQMMTLGIVGLTWLLVPGREVRADWQTLGEKLAEELQKHGEDFLLNGIPQMARSALDEAFVSGIRNPVLAGLSGATPEERQHIGLALDEVQDIQGDVIQNWTSRMMRGGNIMDSLKQSVDARLKLDQPTFQYPFDSGFSFEVGIPKPSTSQTPLEMLENLRLDRPVIDPTKLSLSWDVFDFQSNSDFDRLRVRGSVKADNFLDSSFHVISPAWKANASLEWTFFQNGALNSLSVQMFGEFNRQNSGDVWGASFNYTVRF